MYPDNSQPTNPADYLDQISANPTRNKNLFNNRPLVIGLVTAVVLIVFILIAILLSGGFKPLEQLAARLQATSSIVDSSTGKIKSSKLKAINSSLHSQLINTVRDIEPILDKDNINIDKLSKAALSKESDEEILSRLEDARLNAIYDRTYAREMAYQLDKLLTLMRQLYNSSKNENTKSFLDNSYKNIEPIQKDFANFNASNL